MGSKPHLFRFAGAHDRFRPAFDLPIEATAASDVNAEAAMVVLADVLPDRFRIMALQRGGEELPGLPAGDLEPEELG